MDPTQKQFSENCRITSPRGASKANSYQFTRRLRGSLLAAFITSVVQVQTLLNAATIDETSSLSAFAKTWGILKYYSPRVASGGIDWDDALIEAIPRVRQAATKKDLNRELMKLIRAADLHNIPKTGFAGKQQSEAAFRWIGDGVLDSETRSILNTISHTTAPATNQYVKATPEIGTADFSGELPYATPEHPDVEHRLLALFRYWNMVQYFFPYRDVIGRDWSEVLNEAIPRFVKAADATAYHLEVSRLAASINDGHAGTRSPILDANWGNFRMPLRVRFIDRQSVVVRVF